MFCVGFLLFSQIWKFKTIPEKIWSIGKGGVARRNVSGNINDVLQWTEEELAKIDAATWMRCIDHQMEELLHLMEHDGIVAPKGIIIEDEDILPQEFADNIKVHTYNDPNLTNPFQKQIQAILKIRFLIKLKF